MDRVAEDGRCDFVNDVDPEAEDLIRLLLFAEGEPLSTEDLIDETMLILVGGDETTRHVMSGALEALLLHREQFEALLAAGADRELRARDRGPPRHVLTEFERRPAISSWAAR